MLIHITLTRKRIKMILTYQIRESGITEKFLEFTFSNIYSAFEYLFKENLLDDFCFESSDYLLYTRGDFNSIVYQTTLKDEEGDYINLKGLTFKIITKIVDDKEYIDKICSPDEIEVLIDELRCSYPNNNYKIHTYNKLPVCYQ